MIGKLVNKNFHLWTRRKMDRMACEVYLIERLEDGSIRNYTLEQNDAFGNVFKVETTTPRADGAVLIDSLGWKPLFTMDEQMLFSLAAAMAKFCDEEGIPRPSEDHMRGKLEAVQEHLADMRKLLFNPMTQFVTVGNDPRKGVSFGTDRDLEGERDSDGRRVQQDQ